MNRTTFLKPLHAGKGRSIAQVLGQSIDYVKNPDKTDNGEWISAYQCNPSIVDAEFLCSKRQYAAYTRKQHKQEYAALSAENKKLYPGQKTARKEMIDLLTAKSNMERFLEIKIEQPDRKEQQQEESR